MTTILVAKVKSNQDVRKSGRLECVLLDRPVATSEGTGSKVTPVRYTAPYNPTVKGFGGVKGGGFTAPPESGDLILVCRPENDREYYYLSTVMGRQPKNKDGATNMPSGHKSYLSEGSDFESDTSIGLSHPYGNSIEFTNRDGSVESREHRLELHSGGDGFITLEDSPKKQKVHMQATPKTFISLVSSANEEAISGPDSVHVTGHYNTDIGCTHGSLKIGTKVTGSNLNIENEASPVGSGVPSKKIGDVGIRSAFNAIEIIAGNLNFNPAGVVTALGPVFPAIYQEANQLNSGSYIQQRAGGKIEILQISPTPGANGWGIDIVAMGDINIKSLTGSVNIDGVTTNIQGDLGVPTPLPRIPTKDGIP